MVKDILPAWERWAYWVFGLSSLGYCYWRLFTEGNALHGSLEDGWSFIGRFRDSDEEWSVWMLHLKEMLGLCAVHILVSQACRICRCSLMTHLCMLVLCDLASISAVFGLKITVYMLLKVCLVWLAARFAGVLAVWAITFAFVAMTVWDFTSHIELSMFRLSYFEMYLYVAADGFFAIRLVSFGVEHSKLQHLSDDAPHLKRKLSGEQNDSGEFKKGGNKDKPTDKCIPAGKNSSSNNGGIYCLQVLLYLFYFPTFLHGPILIFPEFRDDVVKSLTATCSTAKVKNIVLNIIRLGMWGCFFEISLHFIYIYDMSWTTADLSLSAVVAIAHAAGQYFMVKYVVKYGLASQLSRFDGISPPPEPRCISWVYSYTDQWKYFDAGLYAFMRNYIYIPLGGSRYGIVRQLTASAVVFFFIYFWHGASQTIFIWSCGNFIVGSLEALVIAFYKTSHGQRFISTIGPVFTLRLKGLLYAHANMASALQSMYFILGMHPGTQIKTRFILTSSWPQFIVLMSGFYCYMQNAFYVKELPCTYWKKSQL